MCGLLRKFNLTNEKFISSIREECVDRNCSPIPDPALIEASGAPPSPAELT
jgi:hypothetical protein